MPTARFDNLRRLRFAILLPRFVNDIVQFFVSGIIVRLLLSVRTIAFIGEETRRVSISFGIATREEIRLESEAI